MADPCIYGGKSWPPRLQGGKIVPNICGLACDPGEKFCPRHKLIAEQERREEAEKKNKRRK